MDTDTSEQSLVALMQVISAVNAALDTRALAKAALVHAIDATATTSGSIWLREQDTAMCLASYPAQAATQLPSPDAAVLRVLATGRPEFPGQWGQPDGRVGAILPLVARGEQIGVLAVGGARGELPRALLNALAGVIAGALQQAWQVEQIDSQGRRIQAIKRQQGELISIISHDLKNPMASIKGYADLLLRRSARNPDDPNRRGLQVISEQIVRMTGLLDTLLDISHISGERLRIELRHSDLARVVTQLIAELRATAPARDLTLVGADEACPAVFDVGRIRQVLNNVVVNALAYSPDHSPIEVCLRRDGPEAIISVHDYGIGIPHAESERIFDPFFRASSAAGRSGMGMGLFVAQQILARHAGRIWFESAEGEGSTFYVALPVDPTEAENRRKEGRNR